MSRQSPKHSRVGRRALTVPACLVLVLIVHAQDAAPTLPAHDFDQAPAYLVVGVTEQCDVTVQLDTGERTLALAGVTVPSHEPTRARLRRFLEQLLVDEEVYVRPESAVRDLKTDAPSPHADLFRAPDGLFVNLEAVRQGYAKTRVKPAGEHLELLRYYEQRARKARKGVWGPRPGDNQKSKAPAATPTADGSPVDTDLITVYVTKTGKKYHREGCPHLRKSSRAISLTEALEKHYEPCSHCKPPTPEDP